MSPYFGLLINSGATISYGNDVADIPRLWLVGNVIIGVLWIVLANGVVVFVKMAGDVFRDGG